MSDEMNVPAVDDGFGDDGAEGNSVRVIQGEKWSFSNEGTWISDDGELISPDREVVVVQLHRVLQKWLNQMPVRGATRFLAPSEHADVEGLNAACPKTEWTDDLNGKPRGPWQLQNICYLVDLSTMAKFTFPTSTVGGGIAIGELKDAVRMMRKFRGPGVYPVVSVGSKPMKTRFGTRPRPYFVIKRWISLGPDGTGSALPAPPTPPAAAFQPPASAIPLQTVDEPTLHEELNDSLPW